MDERNQSVRHLSGGLRDLLRYHAAVYQQLLVVNRHWRSVRSILRVQLLVHASHLGGAYTTGPVHHGLRSNAAVPRHR